MKDVDVLVLTGKSGCGKSYLIRRLLGEIKEDMWLLDPLESQPGVFSLPSKKPVVVALDHAQFADDAPLYCNSLLSWARSASVPVIMAAFKVADLRSIGVQLDENVTEVELLGRGGDAGVHVVRGGERRQPAFDAFVAATAQVETGVALQRAARR